MFSAEERNVRWQMLDEKRKRKTRDGFCIPGLLAEPTGTDGFRVLCHQFSPSSLLQQANCLKSSNTFSPKMNKLREALLLLYSIGGQDQETPMPTRRSCRATPPPRKKRRIGVDAPTPEIA